MSRNLPLAVAAALSVAILSPPAAAQAPPEAVTIDPAAALHVSARGLDALGDSIAAVVPTGILVEGLAGNLECEAGSGDVLDYSVEDIQVNLSADEVSVTPTAGHLDVSMMLTLWSDPADVLVDGTCVIALDEACTFGLQPTWVSVDFPVTLGLHDGVLDLAVGTIEFEHGNFGNPVPPGCLLGDALETLQGYDIDIIGTLIDSLVDDQLTTLGETLQESLGGLAQALTFEDVLEFNGAQLEYMLEASSLEVTDAGLMLQFAAKFSAPQYGSCVPVGSAAYQPVAGPMPGLAGLIPDTLIPYHAALQINEDAINQALYAAWQGGLLCLRLADLVDMEITTGYLELVEPDLVAELWPEPKLLDIYISPDSPPLATFADGPTVEAALLMDVYGEELGRLTRFWGNGLYADAGVGLSYADGELSVDLDFDMESHLGVTVEYNEWLPSAIPEGFGGLIPDLAGNVIDLDTMIPSFAIPSFYGLTLADLDMRVVGPGQDWLGLYAWVDPSQVEPMEIGPVSFGDGGVGCDGGSPDITIEGCDTTGGGLGCDSGASGCSGEGSGCSSGEGSSCGSCSATPRVSPRNFAMILVPLGLMLRRRR